MSRKQTVKAKPNKKAELERKRDEKAARRALAKERKNRAPGNGGSDDEEFVSFANQLQAMALKIREVPGDGNCLFRALADQLEGHSRNHLKHRQETVDYMLRHREDFEPFVEDDVPFERHVANLGKPGTFAGNDAIVAFARNNRVNVVIHQLNAPLWQISGLDKPDARELHIAYRYGEHYDSVRRISDNSEDPAALKTEMFSKDGANKKCKNRLQNCQVEDIDYETELADEVTDAVQKVRNATGCTDDDVILQNLEEENYNIETTVLAVLQLTELNHLNASDKSEENRRNEPMPSSLVENDTRTKDYGNNLNSEKNDGAENNKGQIDVKEENKLKRSIKLSNKQRKEQQRQEKKRRQEERHRQKVLENRSNNAENNDSHVTTATEVTLVKAVATLNI